MPEHLSGAPADVVAAIDRLKSDLVKAAGQNLAGLILYGGLARGRYRSGKSDVNIVVLLHDASAGALAAIAPILQTARRKAGVDPLLLTPTEVPLAADTFPTKFLDIKSHNIVLFGVDPFSQLEVTREQVRIRAEQELRNLLLRLRYRYISACSDSVMLARALARIARPFALELEALLHLAGKELPAEDRTASIFEAAASAFDLKHESLARLAELRQDLRMVSDLTSLYGGVLEALKRAADIAAQMKDQAS